MSTDKRTSQTTIDAGVISDFELDEKHVEPRAVVEEPKLAGVPRLLIPWRVRRMLEDDQALLRDREALNDLVKLEQTGDGPGQPFGVREAAAYAARWIAELERANHELRALLVEHDKAAELASDEMTALIARHTGQKSRATAAFFHVFDKVREYGHPVESLTELMDLTGKVYTRKALLAHVDSIRLIVDRMKGIPSALLKHVVGVSYTDVHGNQAGPVVENNRLRRQVDQQRLEIDRLNRLLASAERAATFKFGTGPKGRKR